MTDFIAELIEIAAQDAHIVDADPIPAGQRYACAACGSFDVRYVDAVRPRRGSAKREYSGECRSCARMRPMVKAA